MSKTFAIGKTYTGRSVCDHECIFSLTVIGRTAKTIKVDLGRRGTKSLKLHDGGDHEFVFPFGRYSMAPVISAEREAA